ncbi:phosphoethanolamine transferase [Dysgonomonas sp. Marseille-P4677]|uniref:phosphoethanolamine transferase n=1 Tax=Dysgonomonas sp. Marseille-P4677 TaxID=2364790 RepID=UPI001F314B7D|nr:phosphoethanolamine transferase [Dysgonomonas sp. Marseille-P4677]
MLFLAISFLPILNILAKTKYTFILTFLLAFILTFNAYFAFILKSDVSLEIMASIFETHLTEAVSMMRNIWLPAIITLTISTALLYFAEKELRESKLSIKLSIGYLLIYLFLFLPYLCYKRIKWMEEEELFKEAPIRVIQDKVNLYAPILYGNIFTIMAYQDEMAKLKEFTNQENKVLPKGIILNDSTQTPQKIYLIIGESAYRKHFSLYGYQVKTTPFLDSLSINDTTQIKYYSGIAAAPFTRNALRIALSFASTRDLEPFYKNKNLINMANDAGYQTFWISNQGNSGIQDSYLGYLSASTTYAIFTKGGYLANDDFDLIPILDSVHNKIDKQFFIIHLVGSHNNYSDRYDETDKQAIPGDNSLKTHYDRSIHHTDRVLNKIYDTMQQDSTAIFYYFSDHGEIIGRGHGPWKNGVAQFDIPLITIEKNTDKLNTIVNKYVDPETKLINNSSTTLILAEILGYYIPQKYIEQAIEDGKYVRHADQSYSLYSDVKEDVE